MTTVVLSAGGTGGHLFPAQALAQELLRRGRSVVVMTDTRGRNFSSAFPGATIEFVPAATFAGRSLLALALAPLAILSGIIVGLRKLRRLRPAAVIGFGGYPSLPVMIAAWLCGFPTAIHEQNAVLGRANRVMADRVHVVAASFPFARFAPRDESRVVYTGNPVRPEAVNLAHATYEPPREGEAVNLLVFGGSQGARALSEIVPAALARLPDEVRRRFNVVQQSRPEDIASARAAYAAAGIAVQIATFFDDLPARMAHAHLVVSRSGASTIAELAVIGRPAILIPYPFATDDHQTANAQVMSEAGAAILAQQKDLSAESLSTILLSMLAAPEELAQRAAAARELGIPDAAVRLADLADQLGTGRA